VVLVLVDQVVVVMDLAVLLVVMPHSLLDLVEGVLVQIQLPDIVEEMVLLASL